MSSRCRTSYAGRRTFSSNSHRLRLQLAPTTKPFSFLLFRLWSLQFVGTSCAGPRCTARLRKTDRRSFTTSLTSWWRTRRSCPSPLCASTILGNNKNYETGDGRGIFFFSLMFWPIFHGMFKQNAFLPVQCQTLSCNLYMSLSRQFCVELCNWWLAFSFFF